MIKNDLGAFYSSDIAGFFRQLQSQLRNFSVLALKLGFVRHSQLVHDFLMLL